MPVTVKRIRFILQINTHKLQNPEIVSHIASLRDSNGAEGRYRTKLIGMVLC